MATILDTIKEVDDASWAIIGPIFLAAQADGPTAGLLAKLSHGGRP